MEQKLLDIAYNLNILPEDLVDERVKGALNELNEDKVLKLLEDFEVNLRQSKQGIKNPSAYLMGMAKRVKKSGDIPESGIVAQELENLYYSGHVQRDDIDDRCLDMLKQLSEANALQAISELRSLDTSGMKNVSAFFMSLMKKYTITPSSRAGAAGGYYDRGGGNQRNREFAYDFDQQQQHSHYTSTHSQGGRGERGGGGINDSYFPPGGPSYVGPREQRGGGGPSGGSQYQGQHVLPPADFSHGNGDLPAPRVMPTELLYGFGAEEYIPEIPRPLEGCNLFPPVHDHLEHLIEKGVLEVDDLDNRIMKELRILPEEVALRVVKDFVSLDKSSVRSVSGFLMGIIKSRASQAQSNTSTYYPPAHDGGGLKRKVPPVVDSTQYYANSSSSYHKQPYNPSGIRNEYGGKSGGVDRYPPQYERGERDGGEVMYHKGGGRQGGRGGGPSGGPPAGRTGGRSFGQPPPHVHGGGGIHAVNMEISRYVSQGLLRQDDVDERVREFLAAQEPWVITQALLDFSSKDMSRIMNKSNFLKGIVRKILEGEDRGGGGGGGGGGVPPVYHQPQQYQQQYQQQSEPPSSYGPPRPQGRHYDPYLSRGGGGKGKGKGGWGY